MLLCFVSAWCTNNKLFVNVVLMFFKSRKCILTVKTHVFCKIFILVFLSLLLIILTHKYFKKHLKTSQEPFPNAVSFELVKQSAFMIDFGKILVLVFLSLLLIILARKYLKKHFKMGVQDVPATFQNAACFELVKEGAFRIDFGRILDANWEGFGGLRLRHEPSSLS